MKTAIAVVAIAVAFVSAATASVPPMINYQGKLMQPSGAPVPDGTYSMVFTIYDDPVLGTPGVAPHSRWSETNPSVQVKGGLFSVLLGSLSPLPSGVFDDQNRFFGVKVGPDPEMTPRQQIASVGFAAKAASADVAATVPDGAITTGKLADGAVSTTKLADDSVATAKLADSSVVGQKLSDGAVSTAKVADGAITPAKLEPQEVWHVVGATGEPALQNGWVNYGSNDYPAAFMKDGMGFVHVRGTVKGGEINRPIFQLPVGYKPSKNLAWVANSAGASQYSSLIVLPDGNVQVETAGATNWVYLNCIVFRAD